MRYRRSIRGFFHYEACKHARYCDLEVGLRGVGLWSREQAIDSNHIVVHDVVMSGILDIDDAAPIPTAERIFSNGQSNNALPILFKDLHDLSRKHSGRSHITAWVLL